MLNTKHLQRCIETLESSVALHGGAEEDSVEQEVFRNAIVKGFELVQEVSFKLLRRALKELGQSGRKLEAMTVKELLRTAADGGLLTLDEVERWFDYRDNRNDTAHDYGVGFAHETLALMPGFLLDARHLESVLRERFGEKE